MPTAIKIENLSKKYVIGHQKQEKYTALRDVMMHRIRGVAQRLLHPLSPNREEVDVEEFWALKDINIEIEQGDRVGIIGRNGAGKSTLLKILSRITEPTTGKINIKGRVASLLEVGTGFHPELSGRENIYLNGAILGMRRSEIKRKFDEIVDFAEVEKFLDTPVKRYSSGMYVRLAFAVAAHLEPEILIVDEVLAVGDAQFQKKCLGKMDEVGKDGRTVLFVSHNMSAIQHLCTKAIWLDEGHLSSIGNVNELIMSYLKVGMKNTKFSRDSAVKCGPDVQLTRLEFLPDLVVSKNGIVFAIELLAKCTVKISDLAILLYSALGERVAIIDLRQTDGGFELSRSAPLLIEGKVKSLPLIEGLYSVGLYISYGEFHSNLLELFELTVSSNSSKFDFAPYPPSSRGFIELDFQFRKRGISNGI